MRRLLQCLVRRPLALITPFLLVFALPVSATAEDRHPYNQEVRPILSDACFSCHGADSAARKSNLRLDRREDALQGGRSHKPAISPGQPDQSELMRRITSNDPEVQMPPPDSGKTLKPAQREILRQWIDSGADYQPHWAFLPIQTPTPPSVRHSSWIRNPIDAFVLARLEQEGIEPSPEASPELLHRRVCLDLNGLSPSPQESKNFRRAYASQPDQALRQAVKELLLSPRYGEHMAVSWLDLARYADTSGFQGDPYRSMWRWRDYVIQSFNQNKRFDQFTLEQIAGDLLPNPTVEQRLATGFHRNHRFNTEFGSINDEWLLEYAVDRVETTGAAWLGLTLGCARCHDHKFDPVSQREFYQLAAFFQNVPERGVFWDGITPAFAPSMRAPNPSEERRLQELTKTLRKQQSALETLRQSEAIQKEFTVWDSKTRRRFREELKSWSGSSSSRQEGPWTTAPFPAQLILHLPFDGELAGRFGIRTDVVTNKTTITNQLFDGASAIISQTRIHTNWTDFRKTLPPVAEIAPTYGPGRIGNALRLQLKGPALTLSNLVDRGPITLAFWLKPESENGVILKKLGQQELFPHGILLSLTNQHLHFELHHKMFEFDATMVPIEATISEALPLNSWSHIALSLDGKRRDRGPALYINGRECALDPVKATARGLNTISNTAPFTLGSRTHQGVAGYLDDLWVFDRPLSDEEVGLLYQVPAAIALAESPERRDETERLAARGFHADFISSLMQTQRLAVATAQRELATFEQSLPEVMVMTERASPPQGRIQFRGQYDAPRDVVAPGIPSALGRLGSQDPTNRLGLARWLISESNPLTARVIMNRLWEQLFGAGLVRSSDNLGSQSELPSHPELLDWLASEFIRSGWDLQAMIRLMVTSATYRQSSNVRTDLLQRDPENRLLARTVRLRLAAEAVRDQALLVSGLLVEKVGGPSVTPYLPGSTPAHSPDLYRRSIYSLWQRTRFNPSLATFDAPARESCTAKRPRTNTPLQALALMNEVTYVEAARALALNMIQSSPSPEERLKTGFERAFARGPEPEELSILTSALQQHLQHYKSLPQEAERLIRIGASPLPKDIPDVDVAAYTLIANTLFTLDAFITRE